MRNFFTVITIFIFLFFNSCQVSVTTGHGDDTNTSSKIRNGIELHESGGLKAEQAFLTLEDGSLIPENNNVKVDEKVQCHLIVSGWQKENDMVFPGASEKIGTSDGDVILDEADLFLTYETGVKPEDAKYITLSATITRVEKLFDFYLISFRIWDKKGSGQITGSYKLHI